MVLSDGPAGVRGETWDERSTSASLPSPTALAATWDEALVERLGRLLAGEARRKDVDVLLAPGVNLHRSPLGGRHFEYLSEDPLLTGRIGAAYVRGVQAGGVAATVKHYVANESETDRMTVDARVDPRTLRELYLAPFEQILGAARPWAVMAAYNSVNGHTMTESPLLEEPLKGEWGFDGVVMSDWAATRSTEAAARAALDLAMPGPPGPWGGALVAAVRAGAVPEAAIDDKVRRLLRLAARVGALEGVRPAAPAPPPPDPPAVAALLRDAGAAGMVLARNAGGVLPLAREALRRVAVLGPNAAAARTQGGGSATVNPDHVVSPLDGLRAALGPEVEVTHGVGTRLRHAPEPVALRQVRDPVSGEPGLRVRYVDAAGAVLHEERRLAGRLVWIGEPVAAAAAAIEVEAMVSVDEPGTYRLGVGGVGRLRLEAAGEVLVDEPDLRPEPGADPFAAVLDPPQGVAEVRLEAGRELPVKVRHELGPDRGALSLALGLQPPARGPQEELEAAVRLAADADAAIVVVGTTDAIESEGFDRTTLALPGDQDELVRRVAGANPRTVVVVNSGGPVLLPWRDEAPAVLLTWFGGQEFGAALAAVLLGDAEPGGRLPTTWPGRQEDVPVLSTTPEDGVLEYAEGLHVGYRAWAPADSAPAFAFGHGLGYTSWELTGLDAPPMAAAGEPVVVRVGVRNAGARAGRHVVQAYLSRPDSAVERPVLWLAGFATLEAPPGSELQVDVRLEPRAFEHWDAAHGAWAVEPGPFELRVGPSAAERPLRAAIEVRPA
ncbi:MAG TPA: glycoside hydrolase family 3 C-terminal domain-containing protein [Solirubrobacteraceae bacterium]|nr:glycoside hydrolase family 3 C-terminal domain-containing protein [Solirubrobacteraceae bacterium]